MITLNRCSNNESNRLFGCHVKINGVYFFVSTCIKNIFN